VSKCPNVGGRSKSRTKFCGAETGRGSEIMYLSYFSIQIKEFYEHKTKVLKLLICAFS
jgi:hypothetical protein